MVILDCFAIALTLDVVLQAGLQQFSKVRVSPYRHERVSGGQSRCERCYRSWDGRRPREASSLHGG